MFFSGFFDDYDQSIKNSDIEEKYDLIFSRPLGFIFAKLLHKLGFTPTGISFLGLAIAVIAGILLFWQDSILHTATAGILILLTGVLDSSDGQAARLYNQHSEFGRYLDGLIDSVVFVALYAGGIFHFTGSYTFAGCFFIGAFAGASHSIRSSIYEYYKGEFLYFAENNVSQRNAKIEKITANFDRSTFFKNFVHFFVIDYMKKQQFFKFRSDVIVQKFEVAKKDFGTAFEEIYVQENKPMLTWWAWVGGANVMRNSIIIFSLFGRFDYFAFFSIALFLIYLFVGKLQNRVDQKILLRINSLDKTIALKETPIQQ